MKNKMKFKIGGLRRYEARDFLYEVEEVMKAQLSNERDSVITRLFSTAIEKYDEALSRDDFSVETKAMNEADRDVCEKYCGLKHFVRGLQKHPNSGIQKNATEVMRLFDKYGDIRGASMGHRYTSIEHFLDDLGKLGSEVHTELGIDVWIEGLTLAVAKYRVARGVQRSERGSYQKGLVQECRLQAEEAYRQLIEKVWAHYISLEEDSYRIFIENVGARVEVLKSMLKTRATRSENELEEEQKEPSQEEVQDSTTEE